MQSNILEMEVEQVLMTRINDRWLVAKNIELFSWKRALLRFFSKGERLFGRNDYVIALCNWGSRNILFSLLYKAKVPSEFCWRNSLAKTRQYTSFLSLCGRLGSGTKTYAMSKMTPKLKSCMLIQMNWPFIVAGDCMFYRKDFQQSTR